MKANMEIADVLRLARLYAKHHGLKLSTVSLYAAKQGQLFKKLESGEQSLTFARRDRIALWFAVNWPRDLVWPKGVVRPALKKPRAA